MNRFNRQAPGHRSRRSKRRGGSIIELMLTLGILLNLTFGMVEFGYYFFVKNSEEGAAREGCRAGIVTGATNSSITSSVTNSMSAAGLANSGYTTLIQDTSGNTLDVSTASSGQQIVVKVQATWSVAGAGFRPLSLIGGSKVVLGTCVMRHE